MVWLGFICLILAVAVILLTAKIWSMRHGAARLRKDFGEKLCEDTNVGLMMDCQDKEMLKLAADLDRQLLLLRRARLQYELGDQEIKTAVTNISHDLRTPLTAISGYLQLLKSEKMTEQAKEYVGVIENRTEAMRQLTEELFSYSVVTTASQYRKEEEVLLGEILEDSIASMYGALVEKNIHLEVRMPEKKIRVNANRSGLMRVFGNIINNALKYSDGDLLIRLEEDGEVSFSNHARELDEVEAGKLFQRFYTVQNGRESTGLGLSIARALVEQMGGKIWARKEEEWFTIRILLQAVVKNG